MTALAPQRVQHPQCSASPPPPGGVTCLCTTAVRISTANHVSLYYRCTYRTDRFNALCTTAVRMSRKTVKIDESTFETLKEQREQLDMTWDEYLSVLHDAYNVDAESSDADLATRLDDVEQRLQGLEQLVENAPSDTADLIDRRFG